VYHIDVSGSAVILRFRGATNLFANHLRVRMHSLPGNSLTRPLSYTACVVTRLDYTDADHAIHELYLRATRRSAPWRFF